MATTIGQVSLRGERKTLAQWAKHYNIPFQCVYRRWNQGVRDEDKLFAPAAYKRGQKIKLTPYYTPEAPVVDAGQSNTTTSAQALAHALQFPSVPTPPPVPATAPMTPKSAAFRSGDWVRVLVDKNLILAIVEYDQGDVLLTNQGLFDKKAVLETRPAP